MSQFEGREICRLIKTAGPCFLLGCVAREDFVVSTWIGLGSVTSYRNRFGVITARPALSEVIYTPLDDCCLVPTYLKGLWNFASWLFFLSFFIPSCVFDFWDVGASFSPDGLGGVSTHGYGLPALPAVLDGPTTRILHMRSIGSFCLHAPRSFPSWISPSLICTSNLFSSFEVLACW